MGLAYGNDTLYSIEGFGGGDTGILYSIPMDGGEATVIGDSGLPEPCGVAFNPENGTLWALEISGGESTLWVVPTDGGLPMSVGDTGLDLCGMTYDPENGILYAIDADRDELYVVDPDTADTTFVGETGFESDCIAGVAWDSGDDRLLLANGSVTSELFEMPTNGDPAVSIGDMDAPAVCGLAYIPAVEPPPTTTTTSASTTTTRAADSTRTRPTFTG